MLSIFNIKKRAVNPAEARFFNQSFKKKIKVIMYIDVKTDTIGGPVRGLTGIGEERDF